MTAISAESRLLTLCAREPDGNWKTEFAEAAAHVDWRRLDAVAGEQGLSAYLLTAALDGRLTPPEPALSEQRETVLSQTVQILALDSELARLSVDFQDARIPLIVLKGPALALTLYPDKKLRPYTDLDLVVHEADQAAGAAILTRCGYSERSFEAEAARQAHAGELHGGGEFHHVFVREGHGSTVELHTEPLQLGLEPACEAGRWQRALPVPGVEGVLMLGAEDQMVQLAVHAHKHGFSRLLWLKDLDLLVRRHSLDWELVRDVARREGVQASVWYALKLTALILGTPLPAEARALRPSLPLRMLYGLVWPSRRIADMGGFMRRRAVQFHAAESLQGTLPSLMLMGRRGDRLRLLAQMLLPRRARPEALPAAKALPQ
jgi:hypothetical protein